MKIVESIKQQYNTIMAQPKKERWAYFWDYYKWHIIILVAAIAVLTQMIVSTVTQKESAFTGYFLNCKINVEAGDFLQGFYDRTDIDTATSEAAFYTDLGIWENQTKSNNTVLQRIIAGASMKDADIVTGPAEAFRPCAYNTSKILCDLRQFLDEDTLNTYADRLYYIDGAVMKQLDAPVGQDVRPDLLKYPDPRNPAEMEDPIPVGIDISDRTAFMKAYYFPDTTVYLGFISNTSRPELCKQFLDYLFS